MAPSGTPRTGTSNDCVVLIGSRRKWALLLVGSLVFVVSGVSEIQRHHPVGWFPIAFFGLCGLLSGYLLIRPGRLQVTRQAVTLDQLWHHRTFEFDRCGEFRVWGGRVMIGNKMVTFDYDGPSRRSLVRHLNRAVRAGSAGLPDSFGMSAQDLAGLLNERRSLRIRGQ
jgi:hypothetical protein